MSFHAEDCASYARCDWSKVSPPHAKQSSGQNYAYLGIILAVKQRLKPLRWIGSAKKDLMGMPDEIQQTFGFALYHAQIGLLHPDAKPLKGFASAGVLKVVEDWRGGTYRAVYTVRFADAVYVLHCFQKKSKHGIRTPMREMDLIRARLKDAEAQAKEVEP